MRKSTMSLYLLIIVGAIFILTCPGRAQTDGKSLFETKCSVCHGLDRPKSVVKSRDEWDKTVMRMKAKPGASITDEEAKAIVDYLSTQYGK